MVGGMGFVCAHECVACAFLPVRWIAWPDGWLQSQFQMLTLMSQVGSDSDDDLTWKISPSKAAPNGSACYFIFSDPDQDSAPLLFLFSQISPWEAGDSGPLLILISRISPREEKWSSSAITMVSFSHNVKKCMLWCRSWSLSYLHASMKTRPIESVPAT